MGDSPSIYGTFNGADDEKKTDFLGDDQPQI